MAKVDWATSLRLEHKVQSIVAEQVRTGWQFATIRAKELVEYLDGEIAEADRKVRPLLKMYPTQKGNPVAKPFKKDGTYTKMVEEWLDDEYSSGGTGVPVYGTDDPTTRSSNSGDGSDHSEVRANIVAGPFSRVEWNKLELSQRDKLMGQLIAMGWEPSSYTDKGNPQLTPNKEPCPNLRRIPGDLGPTLSHYFLASHRRSQIQGWLDNVRPDGRLESQVRPNATNTGRGAHRIIANVPKAEEDVFFGKEMRGLFIAAPGRILVGCDAKGLELRMLAHYMNDPEFTSEILEGDVHTVLWESTDGLVPSRSVNKNVLYCMIFGGSDRKMGETAGYTGRDQSRVGKQIRTLWMSRFPALKGLIERVEKAAKRGYLVGLDGRKIWMRRDDSGKVLVHKALNTLLQCGGSIVMKQAMVLQHEKTRDLDTHQVCWYHDETTHETTPELAEEVGEILRVGIVKAGEYLGLNCPMDGDPKIGPSWADIH